jgi:NAD(P)-dependent dehydrogenase (short-subunit alcohol dehydrogenase family)
VAPDPSPTDRTPPAPGPPSGRLVGERALVTGSTSGIGRAIAVEFAREGALVVVHGRDADRGRAVVDEARSTGGQAHFVAVDLAGPGAAAALVAEAATRLGGLTVLVNNAVGVSAGRDSAVAEMSTEYWDLALRINLTAPMELCRAALPHMRAAGHGSIVNVSSRQAERPSAGMAAYCASKGGLNALTRALAVDYGAENIRANTLSPGYVVNDRRDADMTDDRRTRYEAMHLTRLGNARDCAFAAVYLASRESEFLTGTNLQLDGGSSIGRAAVLG